MRKLLALLLLLAPGCDGGGGGRKDIADRLAEIPGLTVSEQPTDNPGYRFFQLTFEQPADHDVPGGATFPQRMTLLHRDENAPTVFATNGYGISGSDFRSELTVLLDANELEVEHRFFPPSRPEPADWSLLTIRQAAMDHHRIAQAFREIYGGAWVSTGASKGGMTAIYHRAFHPDDVDATVAYVAPHSMGRRDARYVTFLENVGDAGCRQALSDFQREVLLRRTAMMVRTSALGLSFTLLGQEKVLEHSALELPFAFWQYGDASLCSSVPQTSATDDEIWGFLDSVSPPSFYEDATVQYYEPYYFQAATQLGYPEISETNVSDLLLHPGTDIAETYVFSVPGPLAFDSAAMPQVTTWMQTSGARLLLIYGGNDPWSAGAFALGSAADSFLYTVPGGNHGSRITLLGEPELTEVFSHLERWTGVTPHLPAPFAPIPPEPLLREPL